MRACHDAFFFSSQARCWLILLEILCSAFYICLSDPFGLQPHLTMTDKMMRTMLKAFFLGTLFLAAMSKKDTQHQNLRQNH